MKTIMMTAALAASLAVASAPVLAEPQRGKSARAQADIGAQATYESLSLRAGFSPDPYRVDLTSGGSVDASDMGGSCTGMIAVAPDVRLTYSAGSLPLTLGAESNADTTLVVNGPDGRWYCDDDSGGDANPMLNFRDPQSGVYEIYVGAYDGEGASASLIISEMGGMPGGGGGGDVDASLEANFGTVSLRAGFEPDPRVISLRAGGDVDASNIASQCQGYVSRAPDVELDYDSGSLPLIISVDARSDTTLVINGPDGQWYCDDDGGESGSNPSFRFDNPGSGVYDIWVGTYESGGSQPARLHISEVSSQ